MRYLIDTNICIYIMTNHPTTVISKFKSKDPESIAISSITVSELQYGVSKSKQKIKNQQRLNEFRFPFTVLPYTEDEAKEYGEIRERLECKGIIIGPLDLLIGTQALSHKLILITNNEKEFNRIDGLEVENWVDEK